MYEPFCLYGFMAGLFLRGRFFMVTGDKAMQSQATDDLFFFEPRYYCGLDLNRNSIWSQRSRFFEPRI